MKALKIWLIIAVLLIAAGAIIGLFAPFLGEVLAMCGVLIPLLICILVAVVGFAQRGY